MHNTNHTHSNVNRDGKPASHATTHKHTSTCADQNLFFLEVFSTNGATTHRLSPKFYCAKMGNIYFSFVRIGYFGFTGVWQMCCCRCCHCCNCCRCCLPLLLSLRLLLLFLQFALRLLLLLAPLLLWRIKLLILAWFLQFLPLLLLLALNDEYVKA